MADVECIFCNKLIPEREIEAHCAAHRAEHSDGQQSGNGQQRDDEPRRHVRRDRCDLTGVPRVYLHLKCEVATSMPEEKVRTYLANPWSYKSDQTYCSGCSTQVPIYECLWIETGENLQHYMDKLREIFDRAEKRRFYAAEVVSDDDPKFLKRPLFWILLFFGVLSISILIGLFTNSRNPGNFPIPRFRFRRR